MEIIDVSVPIHPGMVVYEGDPDVHVERVAAMADGDMANISRLDLGVHTGTHVDAPLHFIEGGAPVHTLPLDVLVGPAHVVDATSVGGMLDAPSLRGLGLPEGAERLLFKTPNSQLWSRHEFTHDCVRFDGDGARLLVDRGVRLVGIDYLSIGGEEAHQVLLGAGVVPVEGLDLRAVEPGTYTFVCLPLRLVGADGAPARAVLIAD